MFKQDQHIAHFFTIEHLTSRHILRLMHCFWSIIRTQLCRQSVAIVFVIIIFIAVICCLNQLGLVLPNTQWRCSLALVVRWLLDDTLLTCPASFAQSVRICWPLQVGQLFVPTTIAAKAKEALPPASFISVKVNLAMLLVLIVFVGVVLLARSLLPTRSFLFRALWWWGRCLVGWPPFLLCSAAACLHYDLECSLWSLWSSLVIYQLVSAIYNFFFLFFESTICK